MQAGRRHADRLASRALDGRRDRARCECVRRRCGLGRRARCARRRLAVPGRSWSVRDRGWPGRGRRRAWSPGGLVSVGCRSAGQRRQLAGAGRDRLCGPGSAACSESPVRRYGVQLLEQRVDGGTGSLNGRSRKDGCRCSAQIGDARSPLTPAGSRCTHGRLDGATVIAAGVAARRWSCAAGRPLNRRRAGERLAGAALPPPPLLGRAGAGRAGWCWAAPRRP